MVNLTRIYTRTGDGGKTGLVGGHRVDKDDLRIECFGTVDELNATVGMARLHCVGGPAPIAALDVILARVQNELFNLGSQLATRAEDLRPTQPVIADRHVQALESEIDAHNADLPELRSFVLPGGGALGAHLHLCRTVCRRAERIAVSLAHKETVPEVAIRYLNRLSDALFVWARFAAMATGQSKN
jgi:cob(I)alamin adenosyltransferase